MMRVITKQKIAQATLIGFFLLSLFGFFCFGMSSAMGMDKELPMSNAPMSILSCMDSQNNVCVMSIANHMDQWESALLEMFRPPIVSLFVLVVLIAAGIIRLQRNQQEALWRHRLRLQGLLSVLIRPFDSILRAFSQGILHSQIYA